MRFALLMLAVLVTASAQAPGEKQYQAGVCPRTADLEVSPSQKYWFEGEIGKKHVRMYLERGGDGVVGVFYDTMNWVPLILGGKWIAQQDAIEMIALTERDAENGLLKGQVTAGGITAIWSAGDEQNGVAFHLKAVTQPKCDGNESWKHFDDRHWPVTFSYPSSWHVSIKTDSITLTCPDASLMAYGGYEVDVRQGAEANNATSDFVQCGDKWNYGYDCKCGDISHCKTAPASMRDGMTILRGDEREWRTYCRNGGYVGQGDGVRRILTFGDMWIVAEGQGPAAEMVERIVGTAKRRR